MYKGTVIHEFLHALGFFHQQSSADRDDYLVIHGKNIKPGFEDNFVKYSDSEVTNLGFKYDYASIMHYHVYTFSNNGQPVMSPTRSVGNVIIGKWDGLSPTDIGKINKMYCQR